MNLLNFSLENNFLSLNNRENYNCEKFTTVKFTSNKFAAESILIHQKNLIKKLLTTLILQQTNFQQIKSKLEK